MRLWTQITAVLSSAMLAAGCFGMHSHAAETDLRDYLRDYSTLSQAKSTMCEGNQVLLTFDLMANVEGCVVTTDRMEWDVYGTADTTYISGALEDRAAAYPDFHYRAFCLITAECAGTVHVKGTYHDERYGSHTTDFYWNFTVDENGNFDAESQNHDVPVSLPGDVNGDGIADAADITLFQQWLTGVPDIRFDNWHNADLSGDGILNAADLSRMKRALIQAYEPASAYRIDAIGYSDELLYLAGSDRSAAVICSAEELEAYLTPITAEQNVAAYLAKYPDSFFEEHVLLLNCIYQSCGGGVMYEITSVFYQDNVLNVIYRDLYELMPYPDIVNGLLAQVVIPKTQYHADAVVWEQIEHELLAEKQIPYTILSQEWIDCGETKSLLCETAAGMDDVRAVQLAVNDTSPLPPEIDDDFFADHVLVMYYTSDYPGYRKITVDSVTREQDAVRVQITSRFPMETIPDTRVCRILLALDAADVPDAKKLTAKTWFMPYWADEDADNVPEVVDASGELTETDIRQLYEQLLQYVLLHETKADFRDFTFVYEPAHRLESYIHGKPFRIYYKGILLYGGELNTDSCIFGSTGYDTNFGVDPAEYAKVDLNAAIISADDVLAMYPDRIQEPELVIYVNPFEDVQPTLAYRAFDRNEYGEYIVDAVTGEEITYIPYLVCVLPVEYA